MLNQFIVCGKIKRVINYDDLSGAIVVSTDGDFYINVPVKLWKNVYDHLAVGSLIGIKGNLRTNIIDDSLVRLEAERLTILEKQKEVH